MDQISEQTEVQVVPGGPILVKGTLRVTQADGSIETREGNTAFCRCGASSKKPYCDGTHRKVDFE
jgi:CDGSH-type Zn-finger protein